jgi:hypothetical protein
MLSLVNFILNNKEHFQLDLLIQSLNMRNKINLRTPVSNLTCILKNTYYAGIKIFNNLPYTILSSVNEKAQFKVALKRYLNIHSFYSIDDYLMFRNNL